jgi:hypothetical protein
VASAVKAATILPPVAQAPPDSRRRFTDGSTALLVPCSVLCSAVRLCTLDSLDAVTYAVPQVFTRGEITPKAGPALRRQDYPTTTVDRLSDRTFQETGSTESNSAASSMLTLSMPWRLRSAANLSSMRINIAKFSLGRAPKS